jgi:hypothetical protein
VGDIIVLSAGEKQDFLMESMEPVAGDEWLVIY